MPRPSRALNRHHRYLASLEVMELRQLLTTITVNSTGDADGADGSNTLSLRQAIEISNGTLAVSSLTAAQQSLVSVSATAGNNIDFAIPASRSANLNVPISGFDPLSQTWTIATNSALPTITHQVTIDGYTQAGFGVPFRYPSEAGGQVLSVKGSPTGGTFTLTTSAPLPVGTTAPIPFNANAAQVLAALEDVVGTNVFVSGGPALPDNTITISFIGQYAGDTIPMLTVDSSGLIGGTASAASVALGVPTTPTIITSTPNNYSGTAIQGNNAIPRLIIDGSGTNGATGFVLDASHSILRGLVIEGFGVGVSVPNPSDVGDLIQGNDIGLYPVVPVDPSTGQPLIGAPPLSVAGQGNSLQGILLGSTNTTVGGVKQQDENVIIGNGEQGISILPGAHGNQVFGNQIGVMGVRISNGPFLVVPNGGDGVLIADSSNFVGGSAAGDGNLISGNLGDGVHIVGPAATRNDIQGNYIGVGPGRGFEFGSDNPGNVGNGVTIENASDNLIGGASEADRNVISGNSGTGVRISGTSGVRNIVQGNFIGITTDGISALGNGEEGVAIYSADNVVGPKNVISANLRGVLLSGAGSTGNLVQGNMIGTDPTGTADLGNAQEGVRIDGAADNTVSGNANGSQVISGNDVGVLIIGSAATGNQVIGSFIGTDVTGTLDLGNSEEGIRIENAPMNTVGGTTATARNLISANHNGVTITGPQATGNVVQGNAIGTGITGTEVIGNELDGVLINQGASGNLIGGLPIGAGNTIAFNRRDGVRIEDQSVSDSILSNSIFANLGLGIDLVPSVPPGPNLLPNTPVITSVATSPNATIILGTLTSAPNTTYVIQFFANSPLDPTGENEGGQFLGQVTAVTGPNGMASYTASVPTVIKSDQFVTATATAPLGNTSQFSAPLPEILGTVQFQMDHYYVDEAAGTATITVTRQLGTTVTSVNYTAGGGTAVPGVDYVPTSGTLSFDAGEETKTFTVPILINPAIPGDLTVNLTLSSPTDGVRLGTISTATLVIIDDHVDRRGPHVTAVNATSGPVGIAQVVVKFDEPLNPVGAINLLNYGYSVRTAGRDGKLGTKDDRLIGISSATYDPTTYTVTLALASVVRNNTPLELQLNKVTDVLGAGVGISDTLGNLLDGNFDGYPGGSYTTQVVAEPGPRLVKLVGTKSTSHPAKSSKHPAVVTAQNHPHGLPAHKAATNRHG